MGLPEQNRYNGYQPFDKQARDIQFANDVAPANAHRIVIALDTAKTEGALFRIPFPVKSVRVETASDSATTVNVSIGSESSRDIQNYFVMRINDSFSLERATGALFLTWAAQPGKTITLICFVDMTFQSGSQLSISAGAVSVSEGTAMVPQTQVSVTTSATLIAAADSTRKVLYIENPSLTDVLRIASVATLTNSLGALPGVAILPGTTMPWNNQGNVYGIMDSTTQLINLNLGT